VQAKENLAVFLTQLAYNNFEAFLKEYLPAVVETCFKGEDNAAAAAVFCRNILSSQVLRTVPQIGTFRDEVARFVIGYLTNGKVATGSIFFGITGPTVATAIEFLVIPQPSPVNPLRTKKIEGGVRAWQKAIVPAGDNSGALFEKGSEALRSVSSVVYFSDGPAVLPILSVIPFLEWTQDLIDKLTPYLLSESLHVAFFATRVMQFILARKRIFLKPVVAKLVSNIAAAPIGQQLNVIYAVTSLVSAVGGEISTDLVVVLLPLIVIGLSASVFDVRVATFNLLDTLPVLAPYLESNEREHYNEFIAKIAETFGTDPGVANTIEFHNLRDIASSAYELLYHVVRTSWPLFGGSKGQN
jgi:hypothetical protein